MKIFELIIHASCLWLYITAQGIDLKIIPETTYNFILEGEGFKLDCVVQFEGTPNVKANFFKDGALLPEGTNYGYHVSVSESVIISLDLYKSTTTLIKNVTDATDKGRYECRAVRGSRELMALIDVVTFTASCSDAVLRDSVRDSETIALQCDINFKAAMKVDYTISWERDGTTLVGGDKYMINDNILKIFKPTRTDLGPYQCVVVLFPTSPVEKQTVRTKPSYLKAGPKIDYHDTDKTMVRGDTLELMCKVTGYPIPSVAWFKNDKKVKLTTRIHIPEYDGAISKLIIYSLEDEDEGIYKCKAENEMAPFIATAEMRVSVKGAVGAIVMIVVSVIVAVALVAFSAFIVYRRRRVAKIS